MKAYNFIAWLNRKLWELSCVAIQFKTEIMDSSKIHRARLISSTSRDNTFIQQSLIRWIVICKINSCDQCYIFNFSHSKTKYLYIYAKRQKVNHDLTLFYFLLLFKYSCLQLYSKNPETPVQIMTSFWSLDKLQSTYSLCKHAFASRILILVQEIIHQNKSNTNGVFKRKKMAVISIESLLKIEERRTLMSGVSTKMLCIKFVLLLLEASISYQENGRH